MRFFLVVIVIISSFSLSAPTAANPDDTTQLHQSEHELERLQTLFREIVEQTEARIQQQSEAVAASNAEAARVREELAKAQQEIERLTGALTEAETVGIEIHKAHAEAEARIERQAEAIAASNAEAARLSEQLAKAQPEIARLTGALAKAEFAYTEINKARAQAEIRIEQQAETSAASHAEAARASEELVKAQQEIQRLTSALIVRVRAEGEARIAWNAKSARLNGELMAARQQLNEMRPGLAEAQSTLKGLDTEFDALGQAISERIEQLFIAATTQSETEIGQLRAKLEATTELISKLDESVISEGFQTAKSLKRDSDDLTKFSADIEQKLIIEASEGEN